MGFKAEILVDGEPVERDSEMAYQVTGVVLAEIDRLLAEAEMVVPHVLREEYANLRAATVSLRADADAVVADMKRMDGDHAEAMRARWLRRCEADGVEARVAVPRIPRVFCRECSTHVEPGNQCQCMEDGR